MLTIFTLPKPFTDKHINIIQRNAIKSWTLLKPRPEVILLGDDKGIKEAALDFQVKHIPRVKRNEYGTPLLDSAFSLAREQAKHEILCYVNADIIFLQDFLKILDYLPEKKEFLVVGRRWDLSIKELIRFKDQKWEEKLKKRIKKEGELHPPGGSDYFVFKKRSFSAIPAFIVGRVWWDNWMIYEARRKRYMVIDATKLVKVVHQDHDYKHQINQGKNREADVEAKINQGLIGNMKHIFTPEDADWLLEKKGIKKKKLNKQIFKKYLLKNPDILPGKELFWQILRPLVLKII